jgi:3-oxoacyl-[acyl-carrier protein] reductase
LDSVVANVGNGRGAPNWNQSATEWEQLLRINLLGSVEIAQAATPLMIESGGGALVFISSIAGVEATAGPLAYSAAKAALINYSKNLSRALADKHIRVNCVAPGNIFFEGGSWDDHLRERREAVIRMIERDVPLRRFGTPEEIGSLVTFLCSEKASFITGACFVADGGQTRAC